jgi:hypothetical protein
MHQQGLVVKHITSVIMRKKNFEAIDNGRLLSGK